MDFTHVYEAIAANAVAIAAFLIEPTLDLLKQFVSGAKSAGVEFYSFAAPRVGSKASYFGVFYIPVRLDADGQVLPSSPSIYAASARVPDLSRTAPFGEGGPVSMVADYALISSFRQEGDALVAEPEFCQQPWQPGGTKDFSSQADAEAYASTQENVAVFQGRDGKWKVSTRRPAFNVGLTLPGDNSDEALAMRARFESAVAKVATAARIPAGRHFVLVLAGFVSHLQEHSTKVGDMIVADFDCGGFAIGVKRLDAATPSSRALNALRIGSRPSTPVPQAAPKTAPKTAPKAAPKTTPNYPAYWVGLTRHEKLLVWQALDPAFPVQLLDTPEADLSAEHLRQMRTAVGSSADRWEAAYNAAIAASVVVEAAEELPVNEPTEVEAVQQLASDYVSPLAAIAPTNELPPAPIRKDRASRLGLQY